MRLTRLEKKLLLKLSLRVLKWLFCVGFIVYTIYRVRLVATVVALLWLWFTSFGCCENGYIPRYHYFFRSFRRWSYEKRLCLSEQSYSCQYIKIGEGIFLEQYLILMDLGAIFAYSEIQTIYFRKVSNLNVVFLVLKNKKKYAFNISESEFKGEDSLYGKALSYFRIKQNTVDTFLHLPNDTKTT